jgi:hypothetical protein
MNLKGYTPLLTGKSLCQRPTLIDSPEIKRSTLHNKTIFITFLYKIPLFPGLMTFIRNSYRQKGENTLEKI